MSAQILDGKLLAAKLKEQLIKEITDLKARSGKVPSIVSIVVGNDPSSLSYLASQKRTAESLGIQYELRQLSLQTSESDLLKVILELGHLENVNGIILNKPLPSSINSAKCFDVIPEEKDIEGMNVLNLGRLFIGQICSVPCTPAAAVELLKSSGIPLKGKTAVVLGRSEIVGKPMALLLLAENMTVTICHSKTNDLPGVVRSSDVVVAAIGKPLFVKGDWIKPGAIVIDVGINQVDGKIVGDVDFESCKEKASFITPVPGGVGPVTSVMLMKNVVEVFKQSL